MRSWIQTCLTLLLITFSSVIYADNFSTIKQLAKKGDVVAQYVVGIMYQQGKGAEKNKPIALNWYIKSAKQNYILAQYSLIAMYQHGDGIEQNLQQAQYWYAETSKARNLAVLNKQQQSLKQIMSLLQPLAVNNDTNAQYLLASLYANNKQENIANYWFLRGALADDKDAQYYIGVTYGDKTGFFNTMQAIYWLEKAAKQQSLDAQIVLASLYEQDKEIAANYEQAAYWYEQAANQGDKAAQSFIAGMYRDGKGVPVNKQKALTWYEKAAKQGDAFSQYNLGQMYEMGNGVAYDLNKAIYWYQQGAKQGHAASQLKLSALQGNPQ
ncbi:SEL1-like repeat protein [Entomomonas asaccharolytica]|uniref:Sel1 repeat family protein n=1 Tax=Entomomonas asaccharolytica TaxID=2785331 RepID=A0A974RVM8_9GAMM|nr:tetratricopeptide repeat protein [Entomomonas asaccharolytica]QQP84321.1 sel1 repeat family protein [Entomomonas asaccharolytica]